MAIVKEGVSGAVDHKKVLQGKCNFGGSDDFELDSLHSDLWLFHFQCEGQGDGRLVDGGGGVSPSSPLP